MSDVTLGLLILLAMAVVAVVCVWWTVAETGDVVDEVEAEWLPYETLRSL